MIKHRAARAAHRAASAALITVSAAATLAAGGKAAASAGVCPPAGAAWQSTSRETAYRHGPYDLDSNEWNPAGGISGTPASWMTTWAGDDGSWGVCANQPGTGWPYPEERKFLPDTPMSSLAAITSGYDESTPPDGQWDSAYDIWLRRPPGAPGQSPSEVMIWTANHGEQTGNPTIEGNVTIAGQDYQMSVCDACNRVDFVFPADASASTVDLLAVLRYAASSPVSSPITGTDPVVTEIDRGWEIYKTNGTEAFTANAYWLSVLPGPAIQRGPTRRTPARRGPAVAPRRNRLTPPTGAGRCGSWCRGRDRRGRRAHHRHGRGRP